MSDQELFAFPKKKTEKKPRKPMKRSLIVPKPVKYQKASISEEMLQNYIDEECLKRGFDSNHTPQCLYEFLASPSYTIDDEIKSFLKAHFFGRPDNEIRKNIDGTPYQLCYYVELKTDSPQSKLNANQKRFLKGKNFDVLRDHKSIIESLLKFEKY